MKLCFGIFLVAVYGTCNAVPRSYQPPNQNQNVQEYPPIESAFRGYRLVPYCYRVAPPSLCIVEYLATQVNYYLGDAVPGQTLNRAPYVEWQSNDSSNYTIVLIDPDTPASGYGNPDEVCNNQYVLWLVTNVPGGNVLDGETVLPFLLIPEILRVGRHRYTVFVYEQSSAIYCGDIYNEDYNRFDFSIESFAQSYGLGDPVAGNFGRVRYGFVEDDYTS